MWEFCVTTCPKARKQHHCDDCARPIPAGEKYIKSEGKMEGDFMTYKSHEDCRAAARAVNEMRDYDSDEGVVLECADLDPDEKNMILQKFPEVARRLGFTSDMETGKSNVP